MTTTTTPLSVEAEKQQKNRHHHRFGQQNVCKGEHERQFAYEAHIVCDSRGFVLGVEVTAGNVHDSVAWDKVYDEVMDRSSGIMQNLMKDSAIISTVVPSCLQTSDA